MHSDDARCLRSSTGFTARWEDRNARTFVLRLLMYPKASLLVRPVSCVSDMAGQRLDAAVIRPRPPGLLL